jgi:hypothetical protein
VLLISDVHGAFDDHRNEVAAGGETLLVLGDLVNLMDYRTGEGITADLLGIDFRARTSAGEPRSSATIAGMRALWREGGRRRVTRPSGAPVRRRRSSPVPRRLARRSPVLTPT